jgi:hypothetical protein
MADCQKIWHFNCLAMSPRQLACTVLSVLACLVAVRAQSLDVESVFLASPTSAGAPSTCNCSLAVSALNAVLFAQADAFPLEKAALLLLQRSTWQARPEITRPRNVARFRPPAVTKRSFPCHTDMLDEFTKLGLQASIVPMNVLLTCELRAVSALLSTPCAMPDPVSNSLTLLSPTPFKAGACVRLVHLHVYSTKAQT